MNRREATRKQDHAIVFSRVSKSFLNGGNAMMHLPVLNDISFTIGTGEFVVILGPSGCGKSTILNILAGFISQSVGDVTVFGNNVDSPSSEHGIIFQEDSLFPWLTVRDNVLFGPRCQDKRPLPNVADYLELVNLPGIEDLLPHQQIGRAHV